MKKYRNTGIVLAALLFLSPFLLAEGQKDSIPLDPSLKHGILENGMQYYVKGNDKPDKRAFLRLVINAGSLMEDPDQLGMAHFLEHMAFNGTEKYAKNDLVHFLQGIGMQFGPDINAHTSFDETVYKLMIPLDDEENLDIGLDILEEWAFHMSLNSQDIQEERGIILEEWRRGMGAARRMMDAAYPDIMYNSLYGKRIPIGSKESILNSTAESIRRFYRDWYRPDLMAIIAVGDFDPDALSDKIIHRFSRYSNPPLPRERREIDVPDHNNVIYSNQSDAEATWTAALVFNKFPQKDIQNRTDYKELLMEDLYLTMANNRLTELQNSPNAPFSQAYANMTKLTRKKTFHSLAVVSPEGELYRGYLAILTEAKRILDHGFGQSEFQRAKKELRSWISRAWNNKNDRESAELIQEYVNHFLNGDPAPSLDYQWEVFNDYIDTITLKDIQKKAELWLGETNRVVYTMSPKKTGLEAIDPARLSEIRDTVARTSTEAPREMELGMSLLSTLPEKGTIISRRTLEAAGAEEWILSNGATLVLKKTDFKENEILFSAMSPGGLSIAEDSDYLSASFAPQLVIQSGAGNFSKTELDRILSGTTASLLPHMGELRTAMDGSCTTEDLETLFQLNYLYFTQPGMDLPVWNSYIKRMASRLENRDSDPMTRYSDLLISLLHQDHPRTLPLTVESLDLIDPEKAYDFYRDRFSRASNFTFFISGSYREEDLVPLVERYLASLPPGNRENWIDRGIQYPPGQIRECLEMGQEALSHVTLVYPGTWTWSELETQIIFALADSLQMIVTEEVREKAAGSYSPSVSISAAKVPREQYYFMISFSCSPDRVPELLKLLRDTLENLGREGPDERFINDVIKARTVYLEDQEDTNRFWITRMERKYFLKLEDDAIPGINALPGNYDAKVFQNRLKGYFNDENTIEVILYPEGRESIICE